MSPWQGNLGMQIRYDITPKISANIHLTNIYNWCWGGTKTPWTQAFPANQYVCWYSPNDFNYLGATSNQPEFGSGFFYGTSPTAPGNPQAPYTKSFNYPYLPVSGRIPFQAYFELQFKL
jgi:hypothetical protein